MTAIISYNRALPEVPGRTPYTRPDQYLEKLGAGDYAVRQGRRPSDMFLVNKLRAAVDQWRDGGYQGALDVSKRLMQFWFDEDHLLKDGSVFRYWWAQRESLETLIYLTEVQEIRVPPSAAVANVRLAQRFAGSGEVALIWRSLAPPASPSGSGERGVQLRWIRRIPFGGLKL